MFGYKVYSIWDGTLGMVLPEQSVDRSEAGWNFCRDLAPAFRIVGLWPDGWPSVALRVETVGEVVERGDKCRASRLRIIAPCEESEVEGAIRDLSEPFAPYQEEMVQEQIAWRVALSRPKLDEGEIQRHLRTALQVRGLADWSLRQYPIKDDAWGSRDAWGSWCSRDAWAFLGAQAAWDALVPRDALAALDAWAPRSPRSAWGAWNAWTALIVQYAGLQGWVFAQANLLTVGIRDAYRHGLNLVSPTGPQELSWVAIEKNRG